MILFGFLLSFQGRAFKVLFHDLKDKHQDDRRGLLGLTPVLPLLLQPTALSSMMWESSLREPH